jgi:CTP synthase
VEEVHERHRHRYEVNNAYVPLLAEGGMRVTGLYPQKHLAEIVELPGHPWFAGTQFHAEYRSRPNRPHPLYSAFVGATLRRATVEAKR